MWWLIGTEMWWLIGSAPDYWGRGPGFESGIISRNDPDALQDHCVITHNVEKIRQKRALKKFLWVPKNYKFMQLYFKTCYLSQLQFNV